MRTATIGPLDGEMVTLLKLAIMLPGKCEEYEDGACEGSLCSANTESVTDSWQQNTKGVGETLLGEGDHERGCHHQPSNQTSIRSSSIILNLLDGDHQQKVRKVSEMCSA